MLKGQTCLVSKALPSSCEQESKWVYMTYLIKVTNGKRCFEDEEEEVGRRKLSKQFVMKLGEQTTQTLNDFHLSATNNHGHKNHGNDGDQSDSNSFIQSLGRDISINCLLRCSRFDYNSLASLNQGCNREDDDDGDENSSNSQ